jgi:hypothetical protein
VSGIWRLACLGILLLAAEVRAQDTIALGTSGYGAPLSPAQITATQNDYAPSGCHRYIIWRLTSDAARSITGLSAATCAQTTKTALRVLWNVGASNITLEDADAGSAAANRFELAADYVLQPGYALELVYDPTSQRWRPSGVDQASGSSATDLTQIEAAAADDQVPVSDSTSASTWRSLPDCNTGNHLTYATASNGFGCEADDGLTYVQVAAAVMAGF